MGKKSTVKTHQKSKPRGSRLVFWLKILLALAVLNLGYHLVKNPIHVLSFFSHPMNKTPHQTWSAYQDIFLKEARGRISASLLAALAQVESLGNPFAAPDWRVGLSTDLTQIYQPASTAFGLLQITRGTFQQMLSSCEYLGVECPTPTFATRARVRDSVVLTSAYLDLTSQQQLGSLYSKVPEDKIVQHASVVHLCGKEVGLRLIKNNFEAKWLSRCGSHVPHLYIRKVIQNKKIFDGLYAKSESSF